MRSTDAVLDARRLDDLPPVGAHDPRRGVMSETTTTTGTATTGTTQDAAPRTTPGYDRRHRTFATRGTTMPDKSPQRPAGKKSGKSLKEKRDAKREKKQSKHSIPS